MSRHTITHSRGNIAYGFDRPLSEYFAQAWADGDMIANVTAGAADVIEFLDAWGVTLPENHQAALMLDMPIGDEPEAGGAVDEEILADMLARVAEEES